MENEPLMDSLKSGYALKSLYYMSSFVHKGTFSHDFADH